jgi:hypothetical protein
MGAAGAAAPWAMSEFKTSVEIFAATVGRDLVPVLRVFSAVIQAAARFWEQYISGGPKPKPGEQYKSSAFDKLMMAGYVAIGGIADVATLGFKHKKIWGDIDRVADKINKGTGVWEQLFGGVKPEFEGGPRFAPARYQTAEAFSDALSMAGLEATDVQARLLEIQLEVARDNGKLLAEVRDEIRQIRQSGPAIF